MNPCRALSLVALLVLCACTVLTPDYRRPPDAVMARPDVQGSFHADANTAVSAAPAIDKWWRLYNSPQLNGLVDRALTANTDLRVAVANLARAQAGLDVSRDARLPQAGFQASGSYARDSAEEQLVAGPLPNERIYSLGASVSYQVDLFGEVRRSIEAAGANVDAARAAQAAIRMTVAAQTVQAFIGACAAGRELEVARRAIDIQLQATRLASRQFSDGRTNSLDVTRSTTQEEQLRSTLPVYASRRKEALYRLAVLTGLPPADFPPNLSDCSQEPSLAQPIPTGDGRALLARRPDVARAEAELRQATANLGVVTADLYPRISLGASGASVGLMKNFNSDDTYKFAIGPLISWQFPNRRRARATIAGAQAQIDAAYARFDGAVLDALREVESGLTTYGDDLQQLSGLQATERSAQRASDDARRLFAAGRSGFLPVLDADRSLLAIQQSVAAQQTRVATDQVQVFLALGGGWPTP
jgi:multidrug efflux system outer membrane protein